MIESCDCSNAGAVIGGIVVAVIFIVVTALTVIVIVVLRTHRGDSTRTKTRYICTYLYMYDNNITTGRKPNNTPSFLCVCSGKDTTMQLSQMSEKTM